MFSNFFNARTTIYQKYCVWKLFNLNHSSDVHIEFIITRLLCSGLEDVITIDYKWHQYCPMTKIDCDETSYLKFLVEMVREHHRNRDKFSNNEDIENI